MSRQRETAPHPPASSPQLSEQPCGEGEHNSAKGFAASLSSVATKCIAVVGPTGSGKTELAIRIAERFGGEILNTDSLQVYRYLDIGTAKPTAAERARVAHHLLDVVNPDEAFSAGDYVRAAQAVLADLAARSRIAVLCGGTGLYFRALLQGISDIPGVPLAVREAIAARLAAEGVAVLHARLTQVDPVAAARIHPHDTQRIVRALEVFEASGQPLSLFQAAQPFTSSVTGVLSVGYAWERAELYRRLDARVEEMLARGLLDEVRGVLARGFAADVKPLRAIGYLEAVAHLEGRLSLAEVVPAIQLRTRHYAKRQITWFKRHPQIFWEKPGDAEAAIKRVKGWIGQN